MSGLVDFLAIAPELLLTVGGLAVLMVAAFVGDRAVRLYLSLALATLVGAIAITAIHSGAVIPAFGLLFVSDAFANYGRVIVFGATALCLAIAPRHFARSGQPMRAEYAALFLFAALGMGMMVGARDLMTLYIGLELNSFASYILASFLRSDDRSTEAGLKYFVLGALASGMLLFGMSLVYGYAGSTSFAAISAAIAAPGAGALPMGLLFGIVFLLAGLAFKIAAVPFHMWTPDVYEGSPTPVTIFFATAPKVAAMAVTARVMIEALGPAADAWRQIVIVLALASIIVGAAGAIGQRNIKRLLAYSSINNIGFVLIGLAAGTPAGIAAVLTYLAVYVVTTFGAFLTVMQLRGPDGRMIEDLRRYAGLGRRAPLLASALAVFLFSLAGIPPLFGFWPKYLVFEAAVQADLTILAIAGAVASVIGAFYYIAVIKTMFFDDADTDAAAVVRDERGQLETGLIVTCALAVFMVGYLFIGLFDITSGTAAAALFVAR